MTSGRLHNEMNCAVFLKRNVCFSSVKQDHRGALMPNWRQMLERNLEDFKVLLLSASHPHLSFIKTAKRWWKARSPRSSCAMTSCSSSSSSSFLKTNPCCCVASPFRGCSAQGYADLTWARELIYRLHRKGSLISMKSLTKIWKTHKKK